MGGDEQSRLGARPGSVAQLQNVAVVADSFFVCTSSLCCQGELERHGFLTSTDGLTWTSFEEPVPVGHPRVVWG